MDSAEAIQILDAIEEKMINEEVIGFSPDVIETLDNIEATHQEIEMIKAKIDNEVLRHLFNIANSVYYGSLKKGSIHSFHEVVTRLGMNYTKVLIIVLSLLKMAGGDEEVEVIFARCYASSVLGQIVAHQFRLRESSVKMVELGGLFSEIARMIMIFYKKKYAADDQRIDEDFIRRYHPYLSERLIENFSLPEYLNPMVMADSIVLESNFITIYGITQLVVSFVAASFGKFGNRLVIEALPVKIGEDRTTALDFIIENQFNAVGLGKYLRVIRKKERLQPKYEKKQKEQK